MKKLSLRRRTIGWLAVAGTSLALLGAGCEDDNGNGDGLNGGLNDDTAPAPAEPGNDGLNGDDGLDGDDGLNGDDGLDDPDGGLDDDNGV